MGQYRLHAKALAAGIGLGLVVGIGIVLGSGGGHAFDAELTFYAIGSILAAAAVGYRFMLWSQRPPTRRYLKRTWDWAIRGELPVRERSVAVVETVGDKFVAQNFIRRRSWYRWVMHLCLSGGCTLAFAITFPLVFGWVHFEPWNGDATIYAVKTFGIAVDRFPVDGVKAFLMFNALNIAALIVLVGLVMAFARRLVDAGERATQRFWEDIVPLLIILAVTVTGLALTVSYKLMAGTGHSVLAVVHLVSVLALLFHIPFGKLFHMFQRIGSLCVGIYKKKAADAPQAGCARCHAPFAPWMQVEDLKDVLDQLGFNYRYEQGEAALHYQEICPACRRKLVALSQGQAIGR